MNELERHLLDALKRLESQYQDRDHQFGKTLNDLTRRLADGAGRMEILSIQVNTLAAQMERLQTLLKEP